MSQWKIFMGTSSQGPPSGAVKPPGEAFVRHAEMVWLWMDSSGCTKKIWHSHVFIMKFSCEAGKYGFIHHWMWGCPGNKPICDSSQSWNKISLGWLPILTISYWRGLEVVVHTWHRSDEEVNLPWVKSTKIVKIAIPKNDKMENHIHRPHPNIVYVSETFFATRRPYWPCGHAAGQPDQCLVGTHLFQMNLDENKMICWRTPPKKE